jgi:glycosyltransferase involved in cell wall biosynthesis
MHNPPKISIVTPTLNHGEYIEDAILSVLKQGYQNFEHIIVDGCSRDNTLAVLQRYPHLRWVSERDACQSDALNKGFRMATGDLVGWLNADEYYLPGALQTIAEFAGLNSRADIFYGDSISVNKEGLLQRSRPTHDFDFGILLYYGTFISTNATFFRRRLFEQGFLVDLSYRIVMDHEYFVRLAACGKVFKYSKHFLSAFRWTGSNLSLQDERRRKERLRVQRTWSRLKLPSWGYDILADIYLAKRVTLKCFNGNYRRELEVLRHASHQTSWFRNEEGRKTCAHLLSRSRDRKE